MITHCRLLLLLAVGLMAVASPALARQDIPGEELYNELAEEVHKVHTQEMKLLQYLGGLAAKQEEELIQQELNKQQQQQQQQQLQTTRDDSLLDDVPAENPVKVLSRLSKLQDFAKTPSYQKPREEKKSNHYMSLCHFKLCNMGRKRTNRYFWN